MANPANNGMADTGVQRVRSTTVPVTKATSSSPRRSRPASYHQEFSSSSTSSGSPKSSHAAKRSSMMSPQRGSDVNAGLALKIPPRVDRTWRRSGSPGGRSSASGSSTGSSDSLPSRKATAILKKLAAMREEDKLLDLCLVFYGGKIKCHRIVLAASSPYFRDILAVSSHLTRHESIEMRGVDMLVVGALVQYAYTSSLTIGYDRVKTLLEAANLFQFQSVIDACVDYLKRSRRRIRQRSSSGGQRSENSVEGRSPSSGESPRSGSNKSTPVRSPRVESPLTTPSPLLSSPREPFNGISPKISVTDGKVADVSKMLQDASLEVRGAETGGGGKEVKDNGLPLGLEVGHKFTRSISTGSEGYLTSSIGSDSSNDSTTHFVFHDTRHPSRLIREMVKLRKEARLTDVVLRTKIKDFPCHRLVLEAASPYLSRVISRDLEGTNIMDVHLRRISPDILQKLIQFMYTRRVAVSERDASQVYRAAKRFGLEDVCHACAVVDPSLESTSTENTSLTDSMLSREGHTSSLEDLLDK